jgi:hypothetical protein
MTLGGCAALSAAADDDGRTDPKVPPAATSTSSAAWRCFIRWSHFLTAAAISWSIAWSFSFRTSTSQISK